MRTFVLLCLMGCTGAPPPLPDNPRPSPAPGSLEKSVAAKEAEDKAQAARYPDQGPPGPASTDTPLANVPAWDGTTWALSDGRTLSFAGTQATLGDTTLEHTLEPHGGALGEQTVRVITPCALALWDGEAWIDGDRTTPACTAEEQAVEPQQVTWDFGNDTLYTFFPGGKAWRRAPKRVYSNPIGDWTEVDGVKVATFGKTEMRLHPVTRCHLAFEVTKDQRINRTTRRFPACDAASVTYDALPYTLWKAEDGDWIDLAGPGVGKLDPQRRPGREPLTWKPIEGGFEAVVTPEGGEPRTLTVQVDGCTATITREGKPPVKAERSWPECGTGKKDAAKAP